jgi:hypothetical protein
MGLKLVSYPKGRTPTGKLLKNRVMRRMFGPKREEIMGSWRRMNNEELRNL